MPKGKIEFSFDNTADSLKAIAELTRLLESGFKTATLTDAEGGSASLTIEDH